MVLQISQDAAYLLLFSALSEAASPSMKPASQSAQFEHRYEHRMKCYTSPPRAMASIELRLGAEEIPNKNLYEIVDFDTKRRVYYCNPRR